MDLLLYDRAPFDRSCPSAGSLDDLAPFSALLALQCLLRQMLWLLDDKYWLDSFGRYDALELVPNLDKQLVTYLAQKSRNKIRTCKSFCGFQSESKMMTVSAVAKLIPRPPARVDRRKQKSCDPSALKCSNAFRLNSPLIPPSNRWKGKWRNCMYSAIKSNMRTICEKMSTRWPVSLRRTNNLSKSTNLPEPRINC